MTVTSPYLKILKYMVCGEVEGHKDSKKACVQLK